jgi:hypothetical protein
MAHSERRHRRAFLRKNLYLKNFHELLRLYRAYLCWKHLKRLKKPAIKWHSREAICWKELTPCETLPIDINYETIILRCFGGQVTMTINIIDGVPSFLLFDELNVDKIFVLTRETVWRLYFILALFRFQNRDLKYFFAFLKIYRAYPCWKHLNSAIEWHSFESICWKQNKLFWNRETFPINSFKTVIYRFFGGKLTITLKIIDKKPALLLYDELNVDKIFVIAPTRETVWNLCLNAFLCAMLRCKIEIENLSSKLIKFTFP